MKVVNGLKIEALLESPFSSMSGGERTKVCLGLILLQQPGLLLLDEPTNHLDISAVEWLEQFIKEYEVSMNQQTILILIHAKSLKTLLRLFRARF
jgi:ATPase subunit of ABC transporter with duplicated ATPase domains